MGDIRGRLSARRAQPERAVPPLRHRKTGYTWLTRALAGAPLVDQSCRPRTSPRAVSAWHGPGAAGGRRHPSRPPSGLSRRPMPCGVSTSRATPGRADALSPVDRHGRLQPLSRRLRRVAPPRRGRGATGLRAIFTTFGLREAIRTDNGLPFAAPGTAALTRTSASPRGHPEQISARGPVAAARARVAARRPRPWGRRERRGSRARRRRCGSRAGPAAGW